MRIINYKTENQTTFKLTGEVTDVTSNWQSNFEVEFKGGHWGGNKPIILAQTKTNTLFHAATFD